VLTKAVNKQTKQIASTGEAALKLDPAAEPIRLVQTRSVCGPSLDPTKWNLRMSPWLNPTNNSAAHMLQLLQPNSFNGELGKCSL
jgi:hypothetical protein